MTDTDASAVDRPNESIDPDALDRDATARGELYRMLARAFEHPDEAFHEAIVSGEYEATCHELVEETSLEITVPSLTTEDDYETLAARYNDLFAVGFATYDDRTDGSLDSTGPPVPLYEIEYRAETSWGDVNLDIARAYEYYDVSVDETRRDNHDNLRLELSFAGYLARREALGGDDGVAGARLDFLDRHLGILADGVSDALADERDTGVYGSLGQFLAAFVAADAADLGDRREAGEIP